LEARQCHVLFARCGDQIASLTVYL
jgi:hypothetical protein